MLGEGADQCRTHATGAHRLKRVFNIEIEIETCSACGGAMKVIAETPDRCIEDPVVIKQILDQLNYKAETRESRALPESRAPPARPEASC